MEDKSQQEKRATGDCPGELITSAKVGKTLSDGTVSTYVLSQSSRSKHCTGVKEGVREVECRTTSDLSKTGDTMVETRPKVGHSEANVATMHASSILRGGHSNPVNGRHCAEVNAGVRGDALGSTSDPGEMGSTKSANPARSGLQ